MLLGGRLVEVSVMIRGDRKTESISRLLQEGRDTSGSLVWDSKGSQEIKQYLREVELLSRRIASEFTGEASD